MKISVNGDSHEVTAQTLDTILSELGYGEVRVATAVNETFVPVGDRATTQVAQGDRVEILAPRQGG